MLIVDGQIHLWGKGTSSPPHRQEPYSAEQAIAAMDQGGVDRALIHPVLWDPNSNELAVEAVRKYPNRFAIMGWFYLDHPNGRDLVAHWKERPGMLGLRFYFNERHKREWMSDGTLDWLWPAAERAGVPVAFAAALFLPTVGEIARRHPGLKLIVDHMAVPPGSRGESAYRFQPELLALAKYPNIAVKATGEEAVMALVPLAIASRPRAGRCEAPFASIPPRFPVLGGFFTLSKRKRLPHLSGSRPRDRRWRFTSRAAFTMSARSRHLRISSARSRRILTVRLRAPRSWARAGRPGIGAMASLEMPPRKSARRRCPSPIRYRGDVDQAKSAVVGLT